MPRRNSPRADNLRRLLADEAARLIDEQGIVDYRLAKRKAAERLGVGERAILPRNSEIEAALAQRQRLFAGDVHDQRLRELREVAQRAMLFFEGFEPRLVGSVLAGTASAHSDVNLHLFAETPELVAMRLIRDDIPYEFAERRMRIGHERYAQFPVYRFVAGETAIDATVFPPEGLRQAPHSPIDGKPMRRARLKEVGTMLAGPSGAHAENAGGE